MRIHTWLKEIVRNPVYAKLIWWHRQEKGLIAIHWKHASYEDYASKDSVLFRQWAIDNNRYDPNADDSPEERKRWKTNFRCALHSATNIKKGDESHCHTKNGKKSYRIYELLDQPDPDKVDQKKKSNQRAAKSKLKADNEKRSYKSRLNKCKTEIKSEPLVYEETKEGHHSEKVKVRKPKAEPMDVYDSDPVATTLLPSYHCNNGICDTDEHAAQLPATLEEFHEDEMEDVGYSSFSDSSSINSQESSYTSSSGESTNAFNGDTSNVPLETVETIFHRRNFDTSQPDLYGLEYYECDDEGTADIYIECGQWGTEVMSAPYISSPNVVTQFYAGQTNSDIGSIAQLGVTQDTHYSLTHL